MASHYVTPTLLRQIAKLETVERLEIDATSLDSSGLVELSRIPSLRELLLSHLSVDVAVAKQLASLSSLRQLDLRDSQLRGEEAATTLAEIGGLHSLSLSGLSVTDADAQPLYVLKQLKELRLSGTRVTAATADRLRQQLPDTNVAYDDFRQDREASEWVLKIGGTVHIIDDKPRWAVSATADLPDHPFRVVSALLIDIASVDDNDLVRLRELVALNELNLSGTGISDEGLSHLQNLTALQVLHVNHTGLNGSGFAHLTQLDKLAFLSAAAAPLTSEGLSKMPALAGLRTLMIQSSDLSGGYLEHVHRLPSLNDLSVWTGTANPGLEHLRGMPLQTLRLRWQQDLPDESLAHLATVADLRELDLTGSRYLTDNGFRQLAKIKTLKKLVLAKTQFGDNAAEAIASLNHLKHFDVTETKLTPAGLAILKSALPKCEIVGNSN